MFITHQLLQNVHRDGDTPIPLWRLKIKKAEIDVWSVLGFKIVILGALLQISWLKSVQTKVGNRPVNMSIDQTSGHYWL